MLETINVEFDETKNLKNISVSNIKIEIFRRLELMYRREISFEAVIHASLEYKINDNVVKYEYYTTNATVYAYLEQNLNEKLELFESKIKEKKEHAKDVLRSVINSLLILDNLIASGRFTIDTKRIND